MPAEIFHITPAPGLEEQAKRVTTQFGERFGYSPTWLAAAPGRVNLIGEHTDYNDGFVLPMAIDRYVIMAGANGGNEYRVHSSETGETATFNAYDSLGCKNGAWLNYVRGVVDGCLSAGLMSGPLDLALNSSVPVGGGLSSSAALEMATATIIEAASGIQLDKKSKAYICQKAEHDYAGVPCGIMDQFASALCLADHLMLLDCRSAEVQMVPFVDPEIALLIINSNVRHELTGGEYADRRAQCERASEHLGVAALRDATLEQLESKRPQMDDILYRRARHVISENCRTLQAADAIKAGDWTSCGGLMEASHVSLRDDFEVSCPELDLLVELAMSLGQENGVFGSRMTGGGFGGCTVSLVQQSAESRVADAIYRKYLERTGIEPSIYVSRPARGAHALT